MKKILVLATGGTIAAAESEGGLVPKFNIEEIMDYIPELKDRAEFTMRTILNLDSSNIQPEEWQIIAQSCLEGESYDAIVITHGTDTMAYTASILTFMLIGLKTPVIITGSQLPIFMPNSDGPKNLHDAIVTALSNIDSGVYIVFNSRVILGCRSTKFRSVSLNAFESINSEYVGAVVGEKFIQNDYFIKKKNKHNFNSIKLDNRVFLLKLIPGTSTEVFQFLANAGFRGIVIEAFGVGGLHFLRRDLPTEIAKLIAKGIEVVVISQCPLELTDLTKYEVGKKADMSGVISGGDMTCEAAVTKLMWALGNKNLGNSVKEIFLTNYMGEISDK